MCSLYHKTEKETRKQGEVENVFNLEDKYKAGLYQCGIQESNQVQHDIRFFN